MNSVAELKKLIAQNKYEEVIKKLQPPITPKKYVNELIQLEGRYNKLKQKIQLGIVAPNISEVEENSFRLNLTEFVDKIGGKQPSNHTSMLSNHAKTLLFEAYQDSNSRIKVISTKDGWSVQSDKKVLFKKGTSRERILWQDTIDQLCKETLFRKIEPSQKFSITYELTRMGLEEAESISDVHSAQHEKFGTSEDPRDGQVYKTVVLNGQAWLAQNLNFDVGDGCWFYNNDPRNGEKYGRLYTWEAAYKACPPGWRLPTKKEWDELVDNFGGSKEGYHALIDNGISGFNGLLGGHCDPEGDFESIEKWGGYWTGTEGRADRDEAFFFYFGKDHKIHWHINSKSLRYSVRCLKIKD